MIKRERMEKILLNNGVSEAEKTWERTREKINLEKRANIHNTALSGRDY